MNENSKNIKSNYNNKEILDLSIKVVNNLRIETFNYNQNTNKINVKTIFPEWLELNYNIDTQLRIRKIIQPYLSQIIQQKIFDLENNKVKK